MCQNVQQLTIHKSSAGKALNMHRKQVDWQRARQCITATKNKLTELRQILQSRLSEIKQKDTICIICPD